MNVSPLKPGSVYRRQIDQRLLHMQNHICFIRSPKKEILGTLGRSIIYACPLLVLAQRPGDRISEMDLDVISYKYSSLLKDTCDTSMNFF